MGCGVSKSRDSKNSPQVNPIETHSDISDTTEDMGILDAVKSFGKGERPRSAMKQANVDSPQGEGDFHRSFSGQTSFSRKVSFKVKAGSHLDHNISMKKGDDVSMKKLVDLLYSKVLSDEKLKGFYVGVDMQKLKAQQEALLLLVFGGLELLEETRPGFMSKDMRKIHLNLLHRGLSYEHFDLFAEHVKETLDSVPGFPEESKISAMTYLSKTRNEFRPLEPGEWPPSGVCPASGASGGTCPVVRGASA